MSNKRPRLALVVGSGSIKCSASLGIIKALKRENITPDLLVGCSGGSLYAGAVAIGYTVEEIESKTMTFWSEDLTAGYKVNLLGVLGGELVFNERSGIIDGVNAHNRLTQIFGDKTFADCKIPFRIVATEMMTGESVTFSEGRIADVARASISIPLIFPPTEINGKLYSDGAVSNPLPIDVAIQEGADIILAMGFELPLRPRLRSYNQVNSHFNSIYINNVLKAKLAFHNLAHQGEIIMMLPEFKGMGNFDSSALPAIIAEGERIADEHMPYLKKLLAG